MSLLCHAYSIIIYSICNNNSNIYKHDDHHQTTDSLDNNAQNIAAFTRATLC